MRHTTKKGPLLLSCFLLPALLAAAVFALAGIYPFGARSLGVVDMPHQYIGFLSGLRDVLTGHASALYLPSMTLGGNMIGLWANYSMGPLTLLTCLFPRDRLYLAVTLIYFLRVGLCGLTAGLYCGERHGWGKRLLLPAAAYGLMAYMLSNAINYQWQDCVILLPVIALGIARLAEGRGWRLYLFALAGALADNFYIGYALCIFSALFFLAELLSRREPGAALWRRAGVFVLASLGAAGLTAVLLVPVFLSLGGGKADFSLSDLTLAAKFPLRSLFVKLLPGAYRYEELMPGGLPNLFCGTVMTALTALYFADRAVPVRRRVMTGCLFAALALSMWVTALDLIWHGLNEPTWYNYRYSFTFSFLMVAASDRALSHLRHGLRPRDLLWPVLAVCAVAVLALAGREYPFASWKNGAAAILAAGAACGLLAMTRRAEARSRRAALLGALLLAVHVAELGANGYISMSSITAVSSSPAAWAAYRDAKAQAFALLDTGDRYVRAESTDRFDLDRCEPMVYDYDGLSHYSSHILAKNLDFLDSLGLDRYQEIYAQYGPGVTSGAESFLGVRYLVAKDTYKPYEALQSTGGYTVYENPNALPVAFTVGDEMTADAAAPDCFGRVQALYDAAAPEVGAAIYAPAVVEDMAVEGFQADGNDYTLSGGGTGSLTYTLTAAADGPLYGLVELPDFPTVTVFVNGVFRGVYATTQSNGTIYLGDFQTGDTVEVKLQTAADITVEAAAFATEDLSALAAYYDAIAPGGCPLAKVSDSHFTGSFTTGEGDSLLLFTMPYDRGWHITVDGEPVQAMEVQGCLMAVPVTAGEHTLEMRFIPRGLIPGGCVSALALACVIVACVAGRKKRQH